MNNVVFTLNKIAILGVLGLSTLWSVSSNAQSLEQAVAEALNTHPDIRQSFARFKSKEEDVNRASAGYLPTVDLTAGYGYEFTDTPSNRRTELNNSNGQTELARGEFGISIKLCSCIKVVISRGYHI